MITREEFHARFDDLKELVTEVRTDVKTLTASSANHEARLGALESASRPEATSSKTGRWATIVTGLGAAVIALTKYFVGGNK